MKLFWHKIKKLFSLIYSRVNSRFAQQYFTAYAKKEVLNIANDVVVKGTIKFTDKRQVVIGKKVVIGKNCFFQSEGGIYIEDGAVIGNNVKIYTAPAEFDLKNMTAAT